MYSFDLVLVTSFDQLFVSPGTTPSQHVSSGMLQQSHLEDAAKVGTWQPQQAHPNDKLRYTNTDTESRVKVILAPVILILHSREQLDLHWTAYALHRTALL